MSFFYMWGSFAGPVLAGGIYDRTESYMTILWGLFVILLFATVLNVILIKPWANKMSTVRGTTVAVA